MRWMTMAALITVAGGIAEAEEETGRVPDDATRRALGIAVDSGVEAGLQRKSVELFGVVSAPSAEP